MKQRNDGQEEKTFLTGNDKFVSLLRLWATVCFRRRYLGTGARFGRFLTGCLMSKIYRRDYGIEQKLGYNGIEELFRTISN